VTDRLSYKAIGVREAFRNPTSSFLFPATPIWRVEGPLGSRAFPKRLEDLLDLVGAVYRVESNVPPRPTNPIIRWEISAPVRDPAFWQAKGGALLAQCLSFLNRSAWSFTFVPRRRAVDVARAEPSSDDAHEVVLFSGGMDSTCGAGLHRNRARTQLVSYYTRQSTRQQDLATDLGYSRSPTQWRLHGKRGKEGMNFLRSLVFLTLGAAVAESFGADVLYQYENGFLAAAIPPSGSFVPTRHAHPEFHRRTEDLLGAVLDRRLEIKNPFAKLTKKEVVDAFEEKLGEPRTEQLLSRTETCWRHYQAHVGGKKKQPGQPCGVCTPCIVRRTARPDETGFACDLQLERTRRHPRLGLTFRAYLELLDIAFRSSDDHELVGSLAPEARALIGSGNGLSIKEAARLIRQFSDEFCDAFGIRR
jgi:7-cyano-7-deazaguanine synthase in queuosine biosynthesis